MIATDVIAGSLMDVFFGTPPERHSAHRKRVYVSGPISLGDREENVRQALEAHKRLMELGYAVMNPILSAWIPWEQEFQHQDWVDSDLPWVEVADALLRLPGESAGADEEVVHALVFGVLVFTSVEELHGYFTGD